MHMEKTRKPTSFHSAILFSLIFHVKLGLKLWGKKLGCSKKTILRPL